MELKNRILLAFNKFYGNFVKDIKVINEELRTIVKANYKVIEKLTSHHIDYYQQVMGDDVSKVVFLGKEELVPILNEKKLVKDITVDMILKAIDNPKDLTVFWNYIYILTVFVLINRQYEDSPDVEALFNAVINVFSKIQQGESVEALIDDILDDDVSSLLKRLEPVPMEKNAPPLPSNNMICDLAKEISSEIDTSNINIDKPEDVLKLMDFTSSNNIVGDIIKKVSSKIHDKINTGELKQEELFGEAMNMMNKMKGGGGGGGMADLMSGMFNNPMMSEMFKSMKKGKAAPRQDVMQKAATRDRLRAKLEQRKS